MGLVYTDITLRNGGDMVGFLHGYRKKDEIREVSLSARVGTTVFTVALTEQVFKELGLRARGKKTVTVADRRGVECIRTDPVEVQWKDRITACSALVIPGSTEVILGSIALDGMDLTVNLEKGIVEGVHGEEFLLRV
jgi:predicted aspartyl protease